MPHQRIISCGSATHHIVDIHLNETHGNEAINMVSRFRFLFWGEMIEVEMIYQIGGFQPTHPFEKKYARRYWDIISPNMGLRMKNV